MKDFHINIFYSQEDKRYITNMPMHFSASATLGEAAVAGVWKGGEAAP